MPYRAYTILLAEDDPDDCLLFTEALGELGIREKPFIVGNGVETMEFLRICTILPDLLFLDINMPLKDGIETLKDIKSDIVLKQLPVVMFSTTKDISTIQKSYQLGANLFMSKPSSFDQLVVLLHTVLRMDLSSFHSKRNKENFVLE